MYDIQMLEKKWVKYNRNKKKPLYILLILLIFAILLSFFYLKYKGIPIQKTIVNIPKTVKEKKILALDEGITVILINKIDKIDKYDENKSKTLTSMSIMNDIPTLPIVGNIPILDTNELGKITTVEKQKVKNIVKKRPKKMHLNIIKSTSITAYKDVEKRFMQSHDTDDSLFLAKTYYRKGNYYKSKYWAMETNKINSNIEDSWLIYIKSKIKLGRKNEAIHILTNYAKKSNSSAAWNLLLKLKK